MPDRSKVLVLPQRGDSQRAISPNVARGVQRGPQSFEESSRDKNPSAAYEQNLKVMSLKQEKILLELYKLCRLHPHFLTKYQEITSGSRLLRSTVLI